MSTAAAPPASRFGGVGGQSASWQRQKTRPLALFEKFRASTDDRKTKYKLQFDKLHSSLACGKELYDDFAWWLLHEYVIETGEYKGNHLSCDTVLNYLSILVNSACDRFTTSTDANIKYELP